MRKPLSRKEFRFFTHRPHYPALEVRVTTDRHIRGHLSVLRTLLIVGALEECLYAGSRPPDSAIKGSLRRAKFGGFAGLFTLSRSVPSRGAFSVLKKD